MSGNFKRAELIFAFLVLADLYKEVCQIAYDESYDEHDLSVMCDEFLSRIKLSPFYIGQLVGDHFYPDGRDEDPDDDELLHSGVQHCVELLRPETLSTLVKHYGSPEGLFVSLRLSKEEEEVLCPDPKSLYLAGADFLELKAWEWLKAEAANRG